MITCVPGRGPLTLSESVLTRLRAEIRTDSGYRVALDELGQILVDCVIRADAQGEAVDKQLKRVQRAAKAAPWKQSNACAPKDLTSDA